MTFKVAERGAIRYRDRRRQLVDMRGLAYGNITPTDIDGCIDFHNNRFAYFELKYRDAPLERGQKLALVRMVDRITLSGASAALFVAEHHVDDPRHDIEAHRCIVRAIYQMGQWRQPEEIKTLREHIDEFLGYWVPPASAFPREPAFPEREPGEEG